MSIITELRGLVAARIKDLGTEEVLSLIESLAEREGARPSSAHVASSDVIRVDADFRPTTDEVKWVATYDPVHQLTWAAAKLGEHEHNRADAFKAAADCRLFGRTDWQAPSVAELLTILDFEKYPACRPGIFKDTLDWTWTRTPYAHPERSGSGRVVLLGHGHVLILRESTLCSARAVLVGQQLPLCV